MQQFALSNKDYEVSYDLSAVLTWATTDLDLKIILLKVFFDTFVKHFRDIKTDKYN